MENELDYCRVFDNIVPFATRAGIKALRISPEYNKITMPLEPNRNHVGTMYAGALFTLAEMMGGAVALTRLGPHDLVPIVTSLTINFLKPAQTDISAEYALSDEETERIISEAEEAGKARYVLNLELKDAEGNIVATTEGHYQVKKFPGAGKLLTALIKP